MKIIKVCNCQKARKAFQCLYSNYIASYHELQRKILPCLEWNCFGAALKPTNFERERGGKYLSFTLLSVYTVKLSSAHEMNANVSQITLNGATV